jgi:hypothetical protein
MATASERNPDLARIGAQLDDLKRLLIMQLVVSGAQSAHIAKVLGIDSSAISRMMPVREIKKVADRRIHEGERGRDGSKD